MPPPSNQRAEIEPPPQVTEEATKGFLTGAVRFGSLSILAHLILVLPHPMHFTDTNNTNNTKTTSSASTSASSTPHKRPLNTALLYRPLVAFSNWISPASRVYRGLTPQFKTFIQLSCMTLGGCIWAERRVGEYLDAVRKVKRAEKRRELEG